MLSNRELDDFLGNFTSHKSTVKKINYPELTPQPSLAKSRVPVNFISDVLVDIWAELGEATMTVRDIINLKPDSVIELDKAAGDTINLFVNGREFARGEVIIIGSNLGIRVDRISDPRQDSGGSAGNG